MSRLKRKRRAKHHYKSQYRKALGTLLKESSDRCGYSLQHVEDVGIRCMEVDHYDPRRERGQRRNYHGNLIAATRTCNGKKGEWWPNEQDLKDGIYIINPYDEHDYGKHIIEDVATGELKGVTPAGKWHIHILDLNANHLVRRRKLRSKVIQTALHAAGATGAKGRERDFEVLKLYLAKIQAELDPLLIPPLPTSVIY